MQCTVIHSFSNLDALFAMGFIGVLDQKYMLNSDIFKVATLKYSSYLIAVNVLALQGLPLLRSNINFPMLPV